MRQPRRAFRNGLIGRQLLLALVQCRLEYTNLVLLAQHALPISERILAQAIQLPSRFLLRLLHWN